MSVSRLRRGSKALVEGTYKAIGNDPSVFAYRRDAAGESVVVALNMSAEMRTIDLGASQLKVALSSVPSGPATVSGKRVELRPFEAAAFTTQP